MNARPGLRALAERAGILPQYTDIGGAHRVTSDATREALLAAMGIDASTEEAAANALERWARADDRLLEPVRVVRPRADPAPLTLRSPAEACGAASWRVEIASEAGVTRSAEGRIGEGSSDARIATPLELPVEPGYYDIVASLGSGAWTTDARQLLIVAPESCFPIGERLDSPAFGIAANLYSVRSGTNWGIGDTGDLRALVAMTAQAGGEFVTINPLHALRNHGPWISPYSPSSRLFRNPLYLDIAAVPELRESAQAGAFLDSAAWRAEISRQRSAGEIDYEAVLHLKRTVLEPLYVRFLERHGEGATERGRAFARFRAKHGPALSDFATFTALVEHFSEAGPDREDWRSWPLPFRSPDSSAVGEFRDAHTFETGLHEWTQFELDRQLAAVAGSARDRGLAIGLAGDLAVGSIAGGADHWAFPSLFADGASIGAPPDDYAYAGQVWGLAPIDPRRLVADRLRYWILLVRNALEHTGALRIDHVMGLFRQFWIPAGRPAGDGAYVQYPARALLAALALESHRRRAIIIGEDLGTVPRNMPARLARHGILSTRVLHFERDRGGAFRPPGAYSPRALAAANTHDLAPLGGFWIGRDITLRRAAGALDAERATQANRARADEARALLDALAAHRVLPAGAMPDRAELAAAVYRYLAHTRSPLLSLSLDDLGGEVDPVNIPGVPWERHRSWTRRMRVGLEAFTAEPDAVRILSAVRLRARRRTAREAERDDSG